MNRITEQMALFRSETLLNAYNAILSFAAGCLIVSGLVTYSLIGQDGVGVLAFGGFFYHIISRFFLEPDIIRGRGTMLRAYIILYANAIAYSPIAFVLMQELKMVQILLCFSLTGAFTALSYYISKVFPVTRGQMVVAGLIGRYLFAYVVMSLLAGGIAWAFSVDLLRYVRLFFPQILISGAIIALCVFYINFFLQAGDNIATKLASREQIQRASIFLAIQISSFIIIMFIEFLKAFSRRKK